MPQMCFNKLTYLLTYFLMHRTAKGKWTEVGAV